MPLTCHLRRPRRPLRGLWLSLAAVLHVLAADPSSPGPDTNVPSPAFIRFVADGPSRGRVETAVRTYQGLGGATVLLFAAVHVGDRAYYQELQRRFTDCDALLYEMIRDPEDHPIGEAVPTDNPLSQLQLGMKRMLELEFQLEALDYSPSNFVHADLDPDTFFRLQRERQESILGLMLRAVLEEQSRAQGSAQSPLDSFRLLMALMNPDRGYALKLVLGRQMSELENMVAGIDRGAEGQGSVLVSARNERAMAVLREQLGRGRRRAGIFYGAGHMPDFHRRLLREGYRVQAEAWLTAWDIGPRAAD